MNPKKLFFNPLALLILLIIGVYYQFFLLGKIPTPTDTLVGAYYPWLDYKWGFPTGVPVKNPPISDVFSQFFVWKYLSVDLIKSGNWPLWNPYSFSGTPLLETYHSATLLPFNVLLLLPKYLGWGLYIFSSTLVAALGMYLLLTKYTKNSIAKIAGSLVFSLSGLMTTWVEFGTGVWAAAALPWIFYSLESFFENKRFKYLFLLSISFVCLFLAGHTQLTVYSSLLLIGFFIFKILNKQLKSRLDFLPILFWLLAVFLCALQFLPTFDFANLSIRADEEYSTTFNFGLNSFYELIRLIAADFFGHPATYNHWDSISYHEQTSFLGTLVLPLIIPLFFKKFRSTKTIFWSILFLITIILALDHPLTQWFYSLPLPLLTYSSASRIFFITSLSAGVLLSIGITKILEDEGYKNLVKKSALAVIGILAVALLFVYFYNQQNFQISFRNSILPFGLLATLIVLLSLSKKWVVYIIAFLIFFDLGRYFLKYNPFVPPNLVFPTTPVIDFLKNQPGDFRIARADWEILPPNTWVAYSLSSVEGYDPLVSLNYAKMFNVVNGDPYVNRASRYVMLRRYPSKYLDALNTKYFLAIKRERGEATGAGLLSPQIEKSNLRQVFEDKNSLIFENPNVKGSAYFAEQVISVSHRDKLVEEIQKKDFDPTKQAVLVGNIQTNVDSGKLTNVQFRPNNIEIITLSEKPGFLVVANAYNQGWQLLANEQQKTLYEVNGALMGFEVPAGETTFKLRYWPKPFDLGLKISIASLVIFILSLIYSMIKRIW